MVGLATMKDELRIPATETSHDALITSQLVAAVSFAARHSGLALADLAPLRPAIVAAARDLYNGRENIPEFAAVNAWLKPFRSYKTD